MNNDLRRLVHTVPFTPFTIHMADGSEKRVPSVDHIAVPPAGGRIWVFGDNADYDILSSLLITRISVDSPTTRSGGTD